MAHLLQEKKEGEFDSYQTRKMKMNRTKAIAGVRLKVWMTWVPTVFDSAHGSRKASLTCSTDP